MESRKSGWSMPNPYLFVDGRSPGEMSKEKRGAGEFGAEGQNGGGQKKLVLRPTSHLDSRKNQTRGVPRHFQYPRMGRELDLPNPIDCVDIRDIRR